MKGCFSILFISVVLAVLASFFGRGCHQEKVEDILTQRVKSGLQKDYPGLDVRYDHLTAIVSGDVSETEANEIRSKVRDLSRGNGRVYFTKTEVKAPEPAPEPEPVVIPKTPANFTIFRNGDDINVSGIVSSDESKAQIANALAGLENMAVSNSLSIGDNTEEFPAFSHAMAAVPAVMAAAQNGRIEASPEKVIVSGTVESEEVKQELLAMFSSEKWAGASIEDNIDVKKVVIERTEPAEFKYIKKGDTITLTGEVDSSSTKQALVEAAQGEGITVIDELTVSNKVKVFAALAGASAFPSLLNSTEEGSVNLSGNSVELAGLVENRPIKRSILSEFRKPVWEGYRVIDKIEVKPEPEPIPVKLEPFNFVILKEADRIDLTGSVGSEETKDLLGKAIKLEGVTVTDELVVDEGTSEVKFTEPLSSGIDALLNASENARIEAKPKKLLLSGLVKNKQIKSDILNKFTTDGWSRRSIDDQIKVMAPVVVPEVVETSPVDFTITKKGANIELAGVVDSADTKSLIGDAVNLENLDISNEITVGENIEALPTYKPATVGIPALLNATKNGKVAINSERVVVAGLVKDEATKQAILNHFSAEQWSSLKLVDQIKVEAPKLSPTLVWNQKNADQITLEGRVPNQKVINTLVKSAKEQVGPEGKVVNNLKIVDNVRNEPWLSAIPVFAAQSLPKVNETEIKIDENNSFITGAVANSTVMNDVSVAFSGIDPPGKLDVNLRIVAPVEPEPVAPVRDKIPELRIKGIGERLVATGDMPLPKTRKAVVDSILGIDDIDHLDWKKLAVGNDIKEEKYLEPLPKFIRNYYSGAVRERQIWLKEESLTLEGIVSSDKAKADAVKLADPLRKNGVKIIDKIKVIKPKVIDPPKKIEPQPPVDPESGELHSVYFGTGEYHIRDNQWETVNALLAKAKATSGKIIIDGFADERGSNDLNRFLSDERAKVIRSHLIWNGVDEKRIVSVVGRGPVSGGTYQQFRRTDVRILEE